MRKLLNWLNWFDSNIIKILAVGFVFLAPLYPKFPLKFIDYTYIAIRLEDLYIAGLTILFAIQLIRKKVTLNKTFLWLILSFWAAVMISFLWDAYIQKTVIYKHLGFLHSIRRIEYSIIFFIITSTIRAKKDFLLYFYSVIITLVIVSVYGIGQKFLGWPAVQTMNPEFAKGHILYLTPEARVSSTFGGHYDLAAYLIFLLPITLGLFLSRNRIKYFILYLISLCTLVLTASRSAFIAYPVAITAFLVYIRRFKLLALVLTISLVLSLLSNNLSSRFAQSLRVKQIYVNELTGQVVIPQKSSIKELPAGSLFLEIKKPVEPETAQEKKILKETILASIRDEAKKSKIILTASEEAQLLATYSAGLKPVNTVISDISFATRIQVEWPRAINAFLKNPIFGKGASTITESTDNDYLRWLGEFGLVGTSIFLFILFSFISFVYKEAKKIEKSDSYIFFGYLFGLLALLIYASYFDIFEASKVAYTFWTVSAIIIGFLSLKQSTVSRS
ncbi:O-antigen ligase family protein [Candidatus Roizmanbacteria bacterium]|nr:O-antigen ligase family protein [Candidatus Roizmanbacteria bacterium]